MAYSWYEDATDEPKEKDTEKLFVKEGDTITCEFTEWILTIDENGDINYAVFQTTDESIALDDSILKSITFRSILLNESGESLTVPPITAIVGDDLTDLMNEGFNNLVLDMKEGESRRSEDILKMKAYGERNQDLITTIPFLDTIPIYRSVDRFTFETQYESESEFLVGQTFDDTFWGWKIRIESITNDTIVIKNEPTIGTEVAFESWNATVVNISSENGKIWLKHNPDDSILNTDVDAQVLEFYNPEFTKITQTQIESQQPFPGIIISLENGIKIDFNRENIGNTIRYDVTIKKIIRD
jgi:FKBP-type peptidyl-prolyl cis-trans isomerase 2